jgi:hypothetical protein
VETVDEQLEDEDKEDSRSASEQDGDLTDTSSAGESVPGTTRPIETVNLEDLQGQDRCHQIHVGTLPDGSNAHLCCGRTVAGCK